MPLADLGSNVESFFNAAAEFFRHLSDIHWTPFALALGSPGWRCSSPAPGPGATCCAPPIPDARIAFLPLAAAYLAGAGINAIVPAHAGDVTKVFLVKRQIPDSSYPAVTSSFLVQTVFDTTVGVLVLLYAITQGLLPQPPQLPDLPAFEISFWADHPQTLAIVVAALLLAIVVGIYPPRPPGAALLGPGQTGRGRSSPSRAATCARSPPGRGSAGSAASPPSGSSSRPSGSAARSAT